MTHAIATPLRLPGGAILGNRLAKSAMSERLAASDGVPNRGHLRLYQRWSEGGAGLLITGNVMVDRRALGESGNVWIEDESRMTELVAWARASTTGGNHAFVQLNHPGRQSPRTLSRQPVAPSVVPLKGTYGLFRAPRALEEHEIEDIVERFARSAAIVKAAGFTGVQIHGAHGYLVSQFLSPRTNKRDDRWGGSVDNRRRFVIEIVRRVRSAVGRGFPVSVKLNSADFQRGGFDETESMAVVEALEAEGIDLLEISGGTYESAAMFAEAKVEHASTRAREAFFLEYAEKVRARTRIPLMVTGGFRSRRAMSAAIESGAVDVIGLARPLVLEPDLPARLLAEGSEGARSVNVSIGVKKLDALIQGAFYQAQIRRLASGLDARVSMNRLAAVVGYFGSRGPVRRNALPVQPKHFQPPATQSHPDAP
jgi:2,4-dienoyl-CoA reductase-like NADH-dependent reductase (Old Yellow Enzyme family)